MSYFEDLQDKIDALQFENDNEMAYYRGKASGYQMAQDKLIEADSLQDYEDVLNGVRKQLRVDKQELHYNDNAIEEDRRFLSGEIDAIDEVRDLI